MRSKEYEAYQEIARAYFLIKHAQTVLNRTDPAKLTEGECNQRTEGLQEFHQMEIDIKQRHPNIDLEVLASGLTEEEENELLFWG